MADEVRVGVGFVGDRTSAEAAADPLEDAITNAMNAAIKVFIAEFRKGISAVGKAFANDPGMRRFQVNLQGVTEELKDAAQASSRFADTFAADLRNLETRARAMQVAIAKTGNAPGLGASIETQLRKTLEGQRDLEQNAAELARNPKLVRAYENRAEVIRSAFSQDAKVINNILKQQQVVEQGALNRRAAAEAAASRERITAANAERSRNVVAQQRAGALELEEARRVSRLKLQDERATARQRLAIIQAVSQQIRALERGISASLRGVGSILGGVGRSVSTATDRITSIFRRSDSQINQGLAPALERRAGLFRRSNADITQGLQPALERRTSIFRREMSQTESVIRSSTLRQSALLQRAEAQASTGIAGAVSGRSQIGSLLGGGLAIGGGFALITKLRQGFQESVNLNESLNKTQQIFGDATDSILEFADTSVEALFVTKSAALEAAANFGIFGKSAGLAGPELANFSKTLTVLATDLASFNNTSIADATTAISAALRGESEPIRKYGVLLDAATLEARAFAEGITDVERKLTPMERVLAANAEILAQTAVMQGDAARTADDFANSSRRAAAASTEFFASIAKFAVPFATLLTNGILPVFKTLTDLVNNEVGPGLRVLRDGLIGAGAALGGLFAAKAAGEALKFLALGLRAVLTPMGLLVTSVALVGAAIKILAERVPAVREAFDRMREAVGDLVSSGLQLASDLFRRLAAIVADRVLPAVERLATFVATNLVSGFREIVDFVQNRAIPALQRFAGFVRDLGVSVRDDLVERFRRARDAVTEFFKRNEAFFAPFIARFEELKAAVDRIRTAVGDALSGDFSGLVDRIRPVLNIFRDLANVIGEVFVGDFGGALARIREFGVKGAAVAAVASAAIAAAFVNPLLGIGVAIAGALGVAFGPQLIDVIRPQAKIAIDKIQGFFSGPNLQRIGLGFLQIVRRIGEIIGSIVSDRRFITALAAIAAAIAATAGAALVGFADGVRQNIPELIDLLGDSLRLAFREAFKFALSNPEVILGVLAGGAVLSSIRRAFATAGAAGATSFGGAFVSGTRAFFQRNQFATGLFGGAQGLTAAATQQAKKEADALVKARAAAARDVAALGLTPTPTLPQSQQLIGPEDPLNTLKQLQTEFGKAATSGALFRTNIDGVFKGAATSVRGFRDVLRTDVAGGFAQVRAGAAGMATNVGQIFTRLKTDLKTAAGGLGQALGGAIASGIGSALSGQLLGTATSGTGKALGLAGIISSALFASAATGGNVGVGVAVGAVGLVTAALSSNEEAARLAKDRILDYTVALRGLETPGEQAAFAIDRVTRVFEALSPEALRLLEQAGINVTDLGVAFANGTLDAQALEDQIRRLPGATQEGFEGFRNAPLTSEAIAAIDAVKSSVVELQTAAAAQPLLDSVLGDPNKLQDVADRIVGIVTGVQGIGTALDTSFKGRGTGGAMAEALEQIAGQERERQIEETATAIDNVGSAIDTLNQKRTDAIREEIDTVSGALDDAREAAQLARDSITSFFTGREGTGAQLLDQLLGSVSGVGTQVGEAINLGLETSLGGAALRNATDTFGSSVAQIIQQAVTENPNITSADLSALLDPLRAGIEQAAGLDGEDLFTPEAGQKLIDQINGFLADGTFDAAVDFASQLEQDAQALEDQWALLNVALEADVTFSRGQIIRALSDIGLTADEAARALGLADFQSVFEQGFDEAGIALSAVDGIVTGLEDGQGRVEAAARALGAGAASALRGELQISSPSKVFMLLGQEIPAGLAEGIAAGVPSAQAELRSVYGDLFARLNALPGSIAENFSSLVKEIFVDIPDAVEPAAASVRDFVGEVFTAIAGLESLAGVDLSKLSVGMSDAANPLSNSGRTANKFADDLAFLFNSSQAHPPGWVQAEDGSWVPPNFFPPPSLGQSTPSSVDMREGPVTQPVGGEIRIDGVTIYETSNARATARETIMALRNAPLIAQAVAIRNRVADDVNAV